MGTDLWVDVTCEVCEPVVGWGQRGVALKERPWGLVTEATNASYNYNSKSNISVVYFSELFYKRFFSFF